MVLPIYTYGTSVLRQRARLVKEVKEKTIEFLLDMFDTMHASDGIGLAANQVGSLDQMIVIDISELEEERTNGERIAIQEEARSPLALINPKIMAQEGLWTMEEGCLSIPGVRDQVKRPETIIVRYRDTKFREIELKAYGLLGRVILHEVDHLNGVLFIDHIGALERKTHREALRDIQRGNVDVNYPVVTAASLRTADQPTRA